MIFNKRSFSLMFFCCFVFLCFFSSKAAAANCVINSNTDINFGSGNAGDLRFCIGQTNLSAGADVITFEITGSILLNNSLPTITDSLAIQGENHNIIIDGQNRPGVAIFNINANSTVVVNISNLTITRANANNPDRGGIALRGGATLNLTNSTIDNNTTLAEAGAGIFSVGSNLNIINSRITNNRQTVVGSSGAGIFVNGGTLTITGSLISGNSLANSSDIGGAGIELFFGVQARIENSTISENRNGNYGAGIDNNRSTLRMSNVTVSDNFGGVQAGGVATQGGITVLRNCTISGNSVTRWGGGIYNVGNGASLTLANTIVAGNSAAIDGQDIYNFATLSRAGSNIVQAAIINSGTITGSGTIVKVDPKLLPLLANGGLVPTRALAINSPARNAGVNAEALDTLGMPLLFDARGQGYTRIKSLIVDVGAYESSILRAGNDSGAEDQ